MRFSVLLRCHLISLFEISDVGACGVEPHQKGDICDRAVSCRKEYATHMEAVSDQILIRGFLHETAKTAKTLCFADVRC